MAAKPTSGENGAPERKPWPMSWVLIIILLYILFQTAYFLFIS
jgi:hypothetical protein